MSPSGRDEAGDERDRLAEQRERTADEPEGRLNAREANLARQRAHATDHQRRAEDHAAWEELLDLSADAITRSRARLTREAALDQHEDRRVEEQQEIDQQVERSRSDLDWHQE